MRCCEQGDRREGLCWHGSRSSVERGEFMPEDELCEAIHEEERNAYVQMHSIRRRVADAHVK